LKKSRSWFLCLGLFMWNPFDFTGKKIVIAGATSGMGRV
jgi:hypothetical protein